MTLRTILSCLDGIVHASDLDELRAVGRWIAEDVQPEGRDRDLLAEFYEERKKELHHGR